MQRVCTFLSSFVVCAALCWGQDQHRELPTVLDDNFARDSAAAYEIDGDVTWTPGILKLSAGSSVERRIDSAARAHVELRLSTTSSAKEPQRSEWRLWFVPEAEVTSYLRFRTGAADTPTTTVALVAIEETDGKPDTRVIREELTEQPVGERVCVEYRHGHVRVRCNGVLLFQALVKNGHTDLRSVRLETVNAPLSLGTISVAAKPRPRQRSAKDQKKLEDAENKYDEFVSLYRKGRYADAARIGEEMLATRRAILPENHDQVASSLHNLGTVYEKMGEFDRAEPLLLAALAIREVSVGRDHPNYAGTLNAIAGLHQSRGEYERATQLYHQAIQIRKSVLGDANPALGYSLNNLGLLYLRLGDQTSAEPLLRQTLEIFLRVHGEQHATVATARSNLGSLYSSLGYPNRAERLMRQVAAFQKSELGEQHPAYANTLNNLGTLYHSMNNYERAAEYYREALAIKQSSLGERHPDFLRSKGNLAAALGHMREYEESIRLSLEKIETEKVVLGDKHPTYGLSLYTLADVYQRMGEFDRARDFYEQALRIQQAALGDHPSVANTLGGLAAACGRLNQHERAESLYRRAIEIRKDVLGEEHSDYASGLNNLGFMYHRMGDYARAEPLLRRATQIERGALSVNATIQSARQQLRNEERSRFCLDNRLANAMAAESTDAVDVALDLWQWKGAVTARQQAYRRVANNEELAPLFKDLQAVTRKLSMVSRRVPLPPPQTAAAAAREAYVQKRQEFEKAVAGLASQRERLEQQIAAGSVEFRRTRESLTTDRLQELLPEGTAFVDFFEYHAPGPDEDGKPTSEGRYLAIVIPSRGAVRLVGLGPADVISDAITAFRGPLTGKGGSAGTAAAAADRLRRTVWLPLEKHLAGSTTVVISPDTALGTLPFAALPGNTGSDYLLERYKFVSLPLAGMLQALFDEPEAHRSEDQALLVLGDVDYDANPPIGVTDSDQSGPIGESAMRSGDVDWQSLPGFRDELSIVEREFRRGFDDAAVTILQQGHATEAEFITNAARNRYLHVITHGFFAESETNGREEGGNRGSVRTAQLAESRTVSQYAPGLLSGVVLTGANNPPPPEDPTADGILTASEIETLNLGNVDLVVLSACETGLGQTAGGEGLTGLQRAFHIAGVRSCVASLWKVDDRATQELMRRFYTNLWGRGMSRIDALRDAQLWMLRHPRELEGMGVHGAATRGTPVRRQNPVVDLESQDARTSPFFWAAFSLSGDWR